MGRRSPYLTGTDPFNRTTVCRQRKRKKNKSGKSQKSCSQKSSKLTDDFDVDVALEGQGQGEVVEGVKADALALTHATSHFGLELAVEELHHDGTVPQQMVLPGFLSHDDVGPPFAVPEFHVGFVVHSVQVLVKAVQ